MLIGARERLVPEQPARLRNGQVQGAAAAPSLELGGECLQAIALLMHETVGGWETLPRQREGRCDRLAQWQGAEALERRDESAKGRGHRRRQDVLIGHVLEAPAAELLRRSARGGSAVAVDRVDLVGAGDAHEERAFA